ncbi:serine aminopeptidase domain-containing protein [Phenylobacterium sp.]|uniref:alpha/beta hydrolase family protein n=1 Tax=Phenylobacterium sp. TaxID=1871053 RepID=UPI00286B0387|nr:alpha/beta hydrolase [Phenylobacterium sp.]
MRHLTLIILAMGLAFGGAAMAAEPVGLCHFGTYRLADGQLVDVGPTTDGMRWRRMDGTTGKNVKGADGVWTSRLGWTERPDGITATFGDCAQDTITFAGKAGRKLRFEVQDTRFQGDGVALRGRLVLPPGEGPVPIAILVHGSESNSAVDNNSTQRIWPANGVGVFVYDKRGTGGSDGRYNQDFRQLARDAAAAVKEARRLAGKRAGRVGLDGGSQGGWIAPLAATLTPVDFVVARFGLAEGALAEDRGEVMQGLTDKGHGPEVLAKAREITDATGKVMASNFTDGWAELDAVRKRYGAEPWFKDIKGEFSGQILAAPEAAGRIAGPFFNQGTSWDYEPLPVLRALDTPMLWILAGSDREAPPAETRRRLVMLAREGRPVQVLEYPNTDHGIVEFETAPDGKRTPTRYADGYYRAVIDFTKTGQLPGRYGAALRLTDRAGR